MASTRFLTQIRAMLDSGSDELAGYDNCSSIEDKVKYFLDNPVIRTLSEKMRSSLASAQQKCLTTSISFREKGNTYYRQHKLDEALDAYTKSVLTCPMVEDLAIAFANRSAVLFDMNYFIDCVKDMHRALDNEYPKHLRYKLYLRMGRSLLKLFKEEEACCAFQKSMSALKDANLSDVRERELNAELQTLLTSSKPDVQPSELNSVASLPILYKGEHPIVNNTSSAIELKFNTQQGRYLTSKRNIPTGSSLFVEKPFTSLLLQNYYTSHCFQCFKATIAGIQCFSCCEITYCSEDCRRESWVKYHRYECQQMAYLNEVGIMHLALRVLLAAGLKNILKLRDSLISSTAIAGVNALGRYDCNYYTVYHLVTHMEKFSDDELTNHVLSSCCMIWLLQDQTKRLKNLNENYRVDTDTSIDSHLFNENKYYLAYLITIHSLQLISNAHAITKLDIEKQSDDVNIQTEVQERIGVAIYPAASLMNHSCNPNIISSFVNDCLVVRTTREIASGEEILNCYGPHYLRMERAERQRTLQEQYKFVCQCESCKNEANTISEQVMALRCCFCKGPVSISGCHQMPTGKCLDCQKSQNCTKQMEKYLLSDKHFELALSQMEDKHYANAAKELKLCEQLRQSSLYHYNKEIAVVYDQLAKCYALAGNYEESLRYLRLSMALIVKIYGDDSSEYALEIPKLTDILIKLIMDKDLQEITTSEFKVELAELLDACDNGIRLLSLIFGEGHADVQDLKEKKNHFSKLNKNITPA